MDKHIIFEFTDEKLGDDFVQFKLHVYKALEVVRTIYTIYGSIQDDNLPEDVVVERKLHLLHIFQASEMADENATIDVVDELVASLSEVVAGTILEELDFVVYTIANATKDKKVSMKLVDDSIQALVLHEEDANSEDNKKIFAKLMPSKKLLA